MVCAADPAVGLLRLTILREGHRSAAAPWAQPFFFVLPFDCLFA
jgi:hypothetical protein